jgi:tetratricopeptide (TPR) repeat protein
MNCNVQCKIPKNAPRLPALLGMRTLGTRAFIQIICFSLALVFLPGVEAQEQSKGTPQSAAERSREDSRPGQIFISGTVVHENGEPSVGAFIELDCSGSVTREANVESNGRFFFPLGESSTFGKPFQDASQDVGNPFLEDLGRSPLDAGSRVSTRMPRRAMELASTRPVGCTLRASLSGYKSSTIELGLAPLSMLNDVGTIVLFPIGKVRADAVSATSLLAPKSAKKALEKARVALRKDKVSDSEKYLKSAIAIYPKYVEAWFQLGRLYQAQRRIKEARDAYTKAIESDNLYVNAYVWLARISAAEQRWQDAADLSERALALDPTAFPETYYVNALASFNLKNLALAEKSARQAERLDSAHRFPKLYLILACISADRDDFVGSIEELRKYLKYGPRGALALQEYAQAPYLDSKWETASESLKKEMASRVGPEVRLVLAEALLGAGMADQAKTELTAFLEVGDIMEMPPRVRDLFEHIQDPKQDQTVSVAANEKAEAQREEPIDYLHYPLQDLPDFEPAADQAPMDGILAALGNNVSRLFADLFNISAVESVQMERIDGKGKADPGRRSEYLYLCLGGIEKQGLLFEEYRSDAQGRELRQLGLGEGYMLTSGFMSAPIIFHPIHQNGNSFRLLGYQKLGGRNTIVMAYAQIPARSSLPGRFQVGGEIQDTFKQGIAWIDAENYQIIRLASDLLQPVPQIGLEKLRTQIDFDEVRFDQATERFWLPVQVVVTVKWNGRILRNTHAYSDFKLFDVATSQRIEKPKNEGKTVEGAADPSLLEKHDADSVQPPVPPAK